jgi:outer membrane protein TolC
LNFPLFNGFSASAKVKRIKAKINQTRFAANQLKNAVRLAVESAMLAMEEAEERLSAQKENVETAKKNLEVIQKRYEDGLVSDLDLRQTRLALSQAETEYYQALFDWNIAKAILEKNIGKKPAE